MVTAIAAWAILSSDLDDKIAAIAPKAAEVRWMEIPWRMDLAQARRDARSTNRPLFMFIMNGHPFGCT